MKRILFSVIIIALIVWLGIQLKLHPSTVAIILPNSTINMESWFALLVIFISYVILYYIWRFIKFTSNLPRRWREQRAQQRLINSIMSLASGDNMHAEALAIEHINAAANPLLHYLAAAFAAQQQRQTEQRDQYLEAAEQQLPNAKLALRLLKAQWQIAAKQYQSALETLSLLQEIAPKQKRVLRLLAETYLHMHRWQSLADLQSVLTKNHVFSTSDYLKMMRVVYEHLLTNPVISAKTDVKQIEWVWDNMPKSLQTDMQMLYLYALRLMRIKQFVQAEKLLEKTLKHSWNWALVRLYGDLNMGDAATQLALAQSWLKAHSNDPDLYYTLARLAVRNKQWDEANRYYRQSLLLRPDAEVYASYAQALENNGRQQESFVNYRRGLLQYLQQNKLDRDTKVTLSE